jgi:WD40 repeat protein
MLALLAASAALAAPVPQPAIKIAPIPKPDPDAAEFDKPPKGALRLLGSRQMRHGLGSVGGFATDGRTLFTSDHVNGIREWDTDTNTLRRAIPTPDVTNVRRLTSTPDGGKLLYDDYKRLYVIDRATKKRLHALEVPGQAIQRLAVSPDGKTVAVGTEQGHVRLFDLATGQLHEFDVSHPKLIDPGFAPGRGRPKADPQPIYSLAWSPDGQTLASAAQSEGVRGWNPLTGEERWALDTDRGYGPIAFTPDGQHVIAPIRTDSIYRYALWDANTGKKAADLDGFGSAYGLTVSADGRYFCNGQHLWDAKAGKIAHELPVNGLSSGVAFSRDGKRVALDVDGVKIFDVVTGKELFDDAGHAGAVLAISVTQDGKLAATAGHDGTARVWEVGTGKLLHTFRGHLNGCATVSLSPDGKRLATGDLDAVRVFDLKSGHEVWKVGGHSQLVKVAFTPNGDTLAVGGGSLTVHLYDAKSGDPLRKLVGYNGGLNSAWHFAWTPDSKYIVSPVCLMPERPAGGNPNAAPVPVGGPGGEGDGKFRFVLWDVKSGERVRVLGEPVERYDGPVAIDAEGLRVAIAARGLSLVELKTGKVTWADADVDGWGGLAFTGDDKLYAKGVCLDAKTGKKESELPADLRQTRALAVPLKGNTVLTAVWGDTAVVVWARK